MLVDEARTLLYAWVESESLRTHCEAVSACMRHMARKQGADEDVWGAVGLLHDMDYERFPHMDESKTGHPFVAVQYLRDHGWSEDICRAILSHANYAQVPRETAMEKNLYAVDELSGLVTAAVLVRPDKSIHSLKASSVRKKMKDKSFAAKVNRDDIVQGAEELGVELNDLIQEVIAGMQAEAERLGLNGVTDASSTT
jgi:putative nucleotidyltransferase with HDIG domain